MKLVRRWALAVIVALATSGAATAGNAAPLGGLSQAASALQSDTAPAATPVRYGYRHRAFRHWHRRPHNHWHRWRHFHRHHWRY